VTTDELQRTLAEPMTPCRFDALLDGLRRCSPAAAFRSLFAVALGAESSGADQWASRLLVELDLPCPLSLEEALAAIARSEEFDLSNRLIPFYLARQFGEGQVIRAVRAWSAECPTAVAASLSGIAYWLGAPLAELIRPHECWLREWRQDAGRGACQVPKEDSLGGA
jgi:hypothetical protein